MCVSVGNISGPMIIQPAYIFSFISFFFLFPWTTTKKDDLTSAPKPKSTISRKQARQGERWIDRQMHFEMPDRAFHDFRASKSVDRRTVVNGSETLLD